MACIKDPASCNGASLDGTEKPASHQSRSTGGGVPGTRFVEGTVAGYLSALAYYLPGEFRETAAVDPTSSWEALRRDPSYATLRDSQKPHLKASVNVCNNVQSAVKNVQYMQTPSSWAWSSGTWFAATGFTATVDAGALPGFPQTSKIVSFTGSEDLVRRCIIHFMPPLHRFELETQCSFATVYHSLYATVAYPDMQRGGHKD